MHLTERISKLEPLPAILSLIGKEFTGGFRQDDFTEAKTKN